MSSWKVKFLRQQMALSDMIEHYEFMWKARNELANRLMVAKSWSVRRLDYVWMACRDWESDIAIGVSPDAAVNAWFRYQAEDSCIDAKTIRKYKLVKISDTRYKATFEAAPMWLDYAPDDSDYYSYTLHVTREPLGKAFIKGVE